MWNINKETVNEIIDTINNFQNDCHSLVKSITSERPNITNQDVTNVWLFKKLAEFEVRLRQLEDAKK